MKKLVVQAPLAEAKTVMTVALAALIDATVEPGREVSITIVVEVPGMSVPAEYSKFSLRGQKQYLAELKAFFEKLKSHFGILPSVPGSSKDGTQNKLAKALGHGESQFSQLLSGKVNLDQTLANKLLGNMEKKGVPRDLRVEFQSFVLSNS